MDVLGNIIFAENGKKYIGNLRKEIDLSKYSSGTYILKVNLGSSNFNKKLILN